MVGYDNVRITSGNPVQGGTITVAVDVTGGNKSDNSVGLVVGSLDRSACFGANNNNDVRSGDTISKTVTIPSNFSGIVAAGVRPAGGGCFNWRDGQGFFAETQLAGVGGVSLFDKGNISVVDCSPPAGTFTRNDLLAEPIGFPITVANNNPVDAEVSVEIFIGNMDFAIPDEIVPANDQHSFTATVGPLTEGQYRDIGMTGEVPVDVGFNRVDTT